jgi:hypothetical protein
MRSSCVMCSESADVNIFSLLYNVTAKRQKSESPKKRLETLGLALYPVVLNSTGTVELRALRGLQLLFDHVVPRSDKPFKDVALLPCYWT